ncbi:MAG: hypothetical protein K0S12_284 [Bacteroidetes bacterium]|jgi:hypothetical protein|nr:hypothetical protein [Bacteroidota bacterium]
MSNKIFTFRKAAILAAAVLITGSLMLSSCSNKESDKNFDSFYEHNKNKEHVVSVTVPVSVVKMVFIGNDVVKEVLNHVDEIKFITYEGQKDSVAHFMAELNTCLPQTLYMDVIEFKDAGDGMDVKVREEGTKVKEGLLISSDAGSFFVVDLKGELDLEKVKKLAENIDLQKLKEIAKGAI